MGAGAAAGAAAAAGGGCLLGTEDGAVAAAAVEGHCLPCTPSARLPPSDPRRWPHACAGCPAA